MNTIVERIKKLLRMKRGGTPAEVETALGLARKIAAEHGIDLDSIDPEEQSGTSFTHKSAYESANVRYDHQYAAKLVEVFFNVDVVCLKKPILWTLRNGEFVAPKRRQFSKYTNITFVGRIFEIEIAIYVFNFLRGHFSRSWKHRSNRRLRSRRSFIYGMYAAIYHKLDQARVAPPNAGLVLTRRAYLNENFPDLTHTPGKTPSTTAAALYAGYEEGKKTEIRKGVDRPQTLQLGL
jgi:hypothetical protein